jgi:hypothetical protein
MAHEKAKQLLALATTRGKRTAAVAQAIALGMPLHEIEKYLDWLEANAATETEKRSGHSASQPPRSDP